MTACDLQGTSTLKENNDDPCPPSFLKDMIDGIANLHIEKIQAPHFILQAKPADCLAAIDKFLSLHEIIG